MRLTSDDSQRDTLRGSLYMVGTAVMFASAFVATKYTVGSVPPLLAAALRFTAAAVVLSAFLATQVRARRSGLEPIRPSDRLRVVILGLLGIFAYHALFFWALQFTSASLSALIVPTTLPLATALMARVILGEPLGPYGLAGVAVATVGVALAVGRAPETAARGPAVGTDAAAPALGTDALGWTGADGAGVMDTASVAAATMPAWAGPVVLLVAVVCFAAYSVLGYRPVARYGALRTTTYATVVGAVLLWVAAGREWGALPHVSGGAWAAIVFMGVGSSGLGLVWHYRGGALLGPGRAAGFLYLVPLFAVTASVFLLGEAVHLWQLVGATFIILGVVLVQRRGRPASTPATAGTRGRS